MEHECDKQYKCKERGKGRFAYKEFTDIETDSLIISAAMTHFGMQKIDGKLKIQIKNLLKLECSKQCYVVIDSLKNFFHKNFKKVQINK